MKSLMIRGIRVVHHDLIELAELVRDGKDFPNEMGHLNADSSYPSDEALVATLLCMRLHDDELTQQKARQCHTLDVWPIPASCNSSLVMPDPRCVENNLRAIRRQQAEVRLSPTAA